MPHPRACLYYAVRHGKENPNTNKQVSPRTREGLTTVPPNAAPVSPGQHQMLSRAAEATSALIWVIHSNITDIYSLPPEQNLFPSAHHTEIKKILWATELWHCISVITDLGQSHYCSEKSDFSTVCQEAFLIRRIVNHGSLLFEG